MKEKTIILIVSFIVIILLIFLIFEIRERNELLTEDPCGYLEEHCTHFEWGNENYNNDNIINNNTFINILKE